MQCLTWGRADRQTQQIMKSKLWTQTPLFRGFKVALVFKAPYSEHEHTWELQTWTPPTERSHWNESVVDRQRSNKTAEVKLPVQVLPKLLNCWPSPSVPSHLSVLTTASTSGMLALWEIALSSFSSWLFKRRYLFLKQDRGGGGEKSRMNSRGKNAIPWKAEPQAYKGCRTGQAAFSWLLLTAFCSLYQASQLQLGETSSKIYQMPLPTLTSFEMMVLCWFVWELMVCKYFPLECSLKKTISATFCWISDENKY